MTTKSTPYRLEALNISKGFSGVQALNDVTFTLLPGEVHALVGENGAGKSTLIKILSGAYQRDSGVIRLNGQEIEITNPNQALGQGIVTIYQETNAAIDLSTAENIYMGRLPRFHGILVDYKKLHRDAETVLNELNATFSSQQRMGDLSPGQCQMVEIAKALTMDAQVIVLDEPTAALTDREVNALFVVIRKLALKGVSIILITHRLVEVFKICDRVTVLRDGQWVTTQPVSEVSEDILVNSMIGRDLTGLFPKPNVEIGEVVLDVRDLCGTGFKNVTFTLRTGEIVGLFGLVGSGRTEVARALFGAASITGGKILLDGSNLKSRSPQEAISSGLSLVPEERKSEGLILGMPVRANITLPSIWSLSKFGFIQNVREVLLARQFKDSLTIRCTNIEMKAEQLSGGNQQKIVIAKWLAKNPRVLIMDEPTRGVDVAGKAEVHGLMAEQARNGVGILMISSELPEVLGMSDRILVMHEGQLVAEISRAEATEELIMYHATGQVVINGVGVK
jgi:ribose transport system ATP-binding protein